ncbi:sodium/potassium-transporting ATPase subunit beta-like [Penaeus chinensis]|uniref:sodium/potassium-transporting ATPase subunit beta-like n=1 Tax=Penaeus chinensis TaxID=139456 RepID=UPI001FB603CB|nr:sodium/potassium-transporting ATPase subunit beta-like [Penaeus chinensis]
MPPCFVPGVDSTSEGPGMASEQDTKSVYARSGPRGATGPPKPPGDESKIPTHTKRMENKQESFSRFLWNPDTKTVLGRTGLSWAKIALFYVFFYLFLAGYFAFMMTVFYSTLDTHEYGRPKYTPTDGSLLRHPGVSIRPRTSTEFMFAAIWFDSTNPASYEGYVESLDSFVEPYKSNQNVQKRRVDCTAGKRPGGVSCNFDISQLGPCASDRAWGFDKLEPCILVKMNKLLNWIPEPYTSKDLPDDAPEELRTYIQNLEKTGKDTSYTWLSCKPVKGDCILDYYPEPGFPQVYFPFDNNPGYLSPIVAIKISNLTVNQDVHVACTLWAKNIVREGFRKQLSEIIFVLSPDDYWNS